MTGIRHIAAAAGSDRFFLTGEFKRRVLLWSFADRRLVAELDTVLDFGGQRLALCGHDTPIVIAGAWERHGVCAYAADGSLLWQRKDLRQPQHIVPAAGGALVVGCFDDRPLHVLTADSGESVATVRGVRSFYGSRFATAALGEVHRGVVLIDTDDWAVRWKAPVGGFAVLAAAPAPAASAVADVVAFDAARSSSVSCLDQDGEVLWRWSCPAEVNCPALAWDEVENEWVGVLKHVNNKRPDTLVRWSVDGEVVAECPLGLFAEHAFLADARHLVTSDGAVRESRRGQVVWQLPQG